MTKNYIDPSNLPVPRVLNPGKRSGVEVTPETQTEIARVAAYGPDYYIKRWEERTEAQQVRIGSALRSFLKWERDCGYLPEDGHHLVDDPRGMWDIPPPEEEELLLYIAYAKQLSRPWRALICQGLRLYFLHHDRPDLFRMVRRVNKR